MTDTDAKPIQPKSSSEGANRLTFVDKTAQFFSSGLFFNSIYAWLRRRRIEFDLFYVCRGDIRPERTSQIHPRLNPLEAQFLSPADMRFLGAHFERDFSEKHLLKMLDQGYRCIALKHNGEIVSYSWFHLQKCDSKYINFELPEKDAYLMGVRTYRNHRGKNLAAYLQQQLESHLAQMGCRRVWAIITFGNLPSLRSHRKADIQPLHLYLYLVLLKKYTWRIKLRSYRRFE